jgi:RecJ-like exonuclease
MRYCPACTGAGFVRRTEYTGCPECGGTGRVSSRNCPACDSRGTQRVELHRVCELCNGTGLRIPPADATNNS